MNLFLGLLENMVLAAIPAVGTRLTPPSARFSASVVTASPKVIVVDRFSCSTGSSLAIRRVTHRCPVSPPANCHSIQAAEPFQPFAFDARHRW